MSDVSSTPSGMTGAGGGNLLRITGMATGLDVDAMVKKMMVAEQTKLDKAKQDQQIIQWKQEAYQDIIKAVKELQSSFFDSASSDKNILSSTNFSPFTVNGSAGSTVDTSVATFTPGVGAQTGKYSVSFTSSTNVQDGQLASAAIKTGSVKPISGLSVSTTMSDLGVTDDRILSFQYNGSTTATDITIKKTDKISDVIAKISDATSGAVKASFSELTGKFTMQTAGTGGSKNIQVTGVGTDTEPTELTTALGLTKDTTAISGSNAIVYITPPGATTSTRVEKPTNNFTIDEMNYNLSSKGDVTVNVGTDSEKVYAKISDFIGKYNAIVDTIQTELTEKKSSSYKPLTDAQKESMSSSQITAWETKAKAGILKNDKNLQNMLNSLRSAFTTAVEGAGFTLGRYGENSIGIDTSTDYTKPGHIDISDPNKLKAAILSNSDQILKMFTNVAPPDSDSTKPYDSSNTKYRGDGIFTRIKNIIDTNVGFTGTTLNTAILTSYANKQYDYSMTGTTGKGTIPDQLYAQQLMITKITNSMSTKQEQYYNQFSRLETAMNTLNAQQAQLSSFSSG